jgi:hypothetical protein
MLFTHTRSLTQDLATFTFFLTSLDGGLKSLDMAISSSCAAALDAIAGFYFRNCIQVGKKKECVRKACLGKEECVSKERTGGSRDCVQVGKMGLRTALKLAFHVRRKHSAALPYIRLACHHRCRCRLHHHHHLTITMFASIWHKQANKGCVRCMLQVQYSPCLLPS